MVTVVYKIGLEIWGPLPIFPQKLAAQNITILARFRTTLQLDREYLWFETRYYLVEWLILRNLQR